MELTGSLAKDIIFALAKKAGFDNVRRCNCGHCIKLVFVNTRTKAQVPLLVEHMSTGGNGPFVRYSSIFQSGSGKWAKIIESLVGKTIALSQHPLSTVGVEKIHVNCIEELIMTLELEGFLQPKVKSLSDVHQDAQ